MRALWRASMTWRRIFMLGVSSPLAMVKSSASTAKRLMVSKRASAGIHFALDGLVQVLAEAGIRGEGGEVLGPAILAGEGAGALGVQGEQGHEVVAALADDERVAHGCHGLEEQLDGGGSGLLAAGGDDELLLAAGDVEEALGVEVAHVARVQPAVLEQLGGGGGVLEVAQADAAAAHEDLPVLGDEDLHAQQGPARACPGAWHRGY